MPAARPARQLNGALFTHAFPPTSGARFRREKEARAPEANDTAAREIGRSSPLDNCRAAMRIVRARAASRADLALRSLRGPRSSAYGRRAVLYMARKAPGPNARCAPAEMIGAAGGGWVERTDLKAARVTRKRLGSYRYSRV